MSGQVGSHVFFKYNSDHGKAKLRNGTISYKDAVEQVSKIGVYSTEDRKKLLSGVDDYNKLPKINEDALIQQQFYFYKKDNGTIINIQFIKKKDKFNI